ncbi:MAG: DNA translocase FtsK 4TM domain-containing protein [Planctomycetes bacterium]|nr:DNA translocase FtsK 4TM domain-containing protein [Planctomycetota bacterium]
MSKSESPNEAERPSRSRRSAAAADAPSAPAGPALVMSPRTREVVALGLAAASLFALLSLWTFRLRDPNGPIPSGQGENLGGAVGYYLANGCVCALGHAAAVPFLLLLVGAFALFLGRQPERFSVKALGAVVFAAMLAILFAGRDGAAGVTAGTPYGAGGRFGAVLSPHLEDAIGGTGRLLLVGFGSLVALLLATGWMFSELLLRIVASCERLWRRWRAGALEPAVAGGAATGAEATAPRGERRRGRRGGSPAPLDSDGELAGADELAAAAAAAKISGATAPGVDGPVVDGTAEAGAGSGSLGAGSPGELGARRSRRRSGAAADARAAEAAEADDDALEAGAEPPPAGRAGAARAKAAAKLEEPVDADAAPAPLAKPAAAAASAAAPVPVVPVPAPAVVLPQRPKPKPKPKPKKPGQSNLPFEEAYPFPPIELFQEATVSDQGAAREVLIRGGEAIVQKLANFGIQSSIVDASVGPAVTQYELRVADSVRVNKVVGFESDLAAALKAVSVRVVAPIPGKDTIGIEVPNSAREKVFMRDLLEQFGRAEDLAIPLFLGKDVAGQPIVEDLARMPHLLIAGTTGSGKSVCINTILLSVLMTRTPQQVKLILVDPKMVELQAYKQVPHLCCDVVTNMKKAPGVLQWAVDEMENRYALLSAAGVNHIRNYNRLGQQELQKRLQREVDPERVQLPYIVVVIDEFADLMNVAANEVEEMIQRLAQKSRAVGMHVILATQRPSSEVITGIIKANLPCQIAFKVNRKIDSRVILDANGAEKLLGYGDMLYMPPGGAALLRAQGTFVADDELQAVVRFLAEQGQQPTFNPELVQTQSSSRPGAAERDDLYRQAVEIVLGQQRGSATLLQRALAVGYTRATRLLELMEADGLVGAFVGSKSRDVLLTLDEWKVREEQMAVELENAAADAEAAAGADGDDDGDGDAEAAARAGSAEAVDGEADPAAPAAMVAGADAADAAGRDGGEAESADQDRAEREG